MLNKPFKVLIGTDASWDAGCTDGCEIYVTGGAGFSAHAAAGEVLVCDKYKNILVAGATIADSDIIYIGQALDETYDVTSETGVAATLRKFIWSDPIEGRLVKSYKGKAYTVKSEQVTTITTTGIATTAGTEYELKIVYKDLQEQKGGGQFIHSYRYVALASSSVAIISDALMDLVNAHSGARVVASGGTTTIVLTGKPIPSCTTGLNDIDEFAMVRFNAYLNVVASDGDRSTAAYTSKATTEAVVGNGTWELVRDAEKASFGYRGFTNQTTFPILKPTASTVKSETYDQIIIEHSKSYIAPDNLYTKSTPLKTVIFIPVTATSNQMDTILAHLNPWFASCPGSFKPIASF